jgi:hypothetical protein
MKRGLLFRQAPLRAVGWEIISLSFLGLLLFGARCRCQKLAERFMDVRAKRTEHRQQQNDAANGGDPADGKPF